MKVKILAVSLLFLLISAVIFNTIFLTECIDGFLNDVNEIATEDTEAAKAEAEKIFLEYRGAENLLSLTVSHNDLSDVNTYFTEMIAYLSLGNAEEATVAKSRLTDALSHLRRLSGLNLSSFL